MYYKTKYNTRIFVNFRDKLMKFTQDLLSPGNVVNKYQAGCVHINNIEHNSSLLLSANKIVDFWDIRDINDLSSNLLAEIIAFEPAVVLFGTGDTFQFIMPNLYADLINLQIGVEFMDNSAACRTYNILQSEERRVVLALIL